MCRGWRKKLRTGVDEAAEAWNTKLDLFEIEGTEDQKAMFYTSLYHTMINPSVYMDVDKAYRGLDHNIHQAEDFTNYTIFSLWDTYRAEHPFLNVVTPMQNADMVKSMIRHQQQSVHKMLPVWSLMGNENWCMSGYHAVPVLADAIAKGVFTEKEEALQAMVETSNVDYYDHLDDYKQLGYIPFEKSSTAVSSTLEFAYDDWTIYQTALRAGNEEIAKQYYARALNYRNVFDKKNGFAVHVILTVTFKKDFDPLQTHGEGFIEGNSWNFSFHVPHDVYGIMDLMGGEKVFLTRLDELFEMHLPKKYYEKNEDITEEGLIGGYVHGNEPSHHIPYLYAWTSQPWKTQFWTREIIDRMYRNDINGLGGNDDCGQMSAWYMFTVMGFYPVCPGNQISIVLGSSIFPLSPNCVYLMETILEIKAEGVSDTRRYVQSLTINGKKYDKLYITHADLLKGGVWEFKMGTSPNKKRGQKAENKPYSLTNGIK